MKRRGFLSLLGLGALAPVLTPEILAAKTSWPVLTPDILKVMKFECDRLASGTITADQICANAITASRVHVDRLRLDPAGWDLDSTTQVYHRR